MKIKTNIITRQGNMKDAFIHILSKTVLLVKQKTVSENLETKHSLGFPLPSSTCAGVHLSLSIRIKQFLGLENLI